MKIVGAASPPGAWGVVFGARALTARVRDSTPNSARLPSMNSTTWATGGRAPPRGSRRAAQDRVRAPQLAVLPLQVSKPLRVTRRVPGTISSISLGLVEPNRAASRG